MIAVQMSVTALAFPWAVAVVVLSIVVAGLSTAFPECRGSRRTRALLAAVIVACSLSFSLHAAPSKPTPNIVVPNPCYTDWWPMYPECWFAR